MTISAGQQETIDAILASDPKGFDAGMGLRYQEVTPDRVRAHITVTDSLLQPFGITHGGVYCAIVESVASVSGVVWLGGTGHVVGVNNNTDFLRSVGAGTELTAVSTPIHRGRRQQLWVVEITDPDKRIIARGQVRLQNMTA